MESFENFRLFEEHERPWHARPDTSTIFLLIWLLIIIGLALYSLIFGPEAFSQAQIPGTDASDKLEAAGTVLRLLDTALFKWGARLLAGVCIMSAAWSLKEQRFGIAVICIIGALLFGTAPTWVKNIFSITGSDSVFSDVRPVTGGFAEDTAMPRTAADA